MVDWGLALFCLMVAPLVVDRVRFDANPLAGVAAWLGLTVVGWGALLVSLVRCGVGAANGSLLFGLEDFVHRLIKGGLSGMSLWSVVGLTLSFDLVVLMLGAFSVTTLWTMRARRRTRTVLDVVTSTHDGATPYSVLDSAQPVAYFVPGRGGRIVLSSATIDALPADELAAVVAHENGHRKGFHGALLLTLSAWTPFVPFVPIARLAPRSLHLYVEMMADDHARRDVGSAALRRVLDKAAMFSPAPAAALGLSGMMMERRRLRCETAVTSAPVRIATGTVIAIVTVATLSLLVA